MHAHNVRSRRIGNRIGRNGLAHVPAKWTPVRRQEHAPIKESKARSDSTRTERALGARQTARWGILARLTLGVPVKFGADTEIFGEGEPVEYVYEVVAGAVRTAEILPDGRRKLGGFHFAGDVFGLDEGNEHSLSAEAIVPSTLRVIKRRTLVQLAADDPKVKDDLLTTAMREVARAHRHGLLLIMTAQERVDSFLVETMARIATSELVQLPMSCQDIADYLGLTIETISRAITGLAGTSAIRLPSSRTIVLLNRSALERGTAGEVGI